MTEEERKDRPRLTTLAAISLIEGIRLTVQTNPNLNREEAAKLLSDLQPLKRLARKGIHMRLKSKRNKFPSKSFVIAGAETLDYSDVIERLEQDLLRLKTGERV